MVVWHLPVVFDWAAGRDWVMNWLMGPSFVVVGLLFWRVILPSHPWGARGSTRIQIAAIVVTAFEMLILAMSMSIFTKAPWYSMNVLMEGPVGALRDQRYAAGILWICGDFWAIPALVLRGLPHLRARTVGCPTPWNAPWVGSESDRPAEAGLFVRLDAGGRIGSTLRAPGREGRPRRWSAGWQVGGPGRSPAGGSTTCRWRSHRRGATRRRTSS